MSQQKFIIQQNFSKVMQTLDCFTGEIELQVTIGIKSFSDLHENSSGKL